jgi:hypothetical protein
VVIHIAKCAQLIAEIPTLATKYEDMAASLYTRRASIYWVLVWNQLCWIVL